MITALLFNAFTGAVFGMTLGVSPVAGAVGANAIALAVSGAMPVGVAREGVLKEIWTGELVKSLREFLAGTWLDGIPDSSSIVDNDVIHLVEVGVDPDVLVNNTTYPIPLQALDDKDIAIQLDKFQTKVTPITDDELYAISYDKIARVKESHSNAINDAKFAKAAHALCAQKNTAKTPVLTTTGERDAATGRLKLTAKDVLAMKAALDKLGVPTTNRRLVLCTDHVNDLLKLTSALRSSTISTATPARWASSTALTFMNLPILLIIHPRERRRQSATRERPQVISTAHSHSIHCVCSRQQAPPRCTGVLLRTTQSTSETR